jgi:hypothetical protein
LGTWLLGQQVLRAGIADILSIVNITDIADVADIVMNIADIAVETGKRVQSVTKVSKHYIRLFLLLGLVVVIR